jgi:quercetin dioxygenase-like cupin family protein
MKRMLSAACLALLAAGAGAHGPDGQGVHETVKPLFSRALPNVPGKALVAVAVSFPPGASAPPHTHPRSAFIYAQVLSGEIVSAVDDETPRVYRTGEHWYEDPGARHVVTRNPSTDRPATLLAVFVVDEGEQLVGPAVK